MTRNTELPPETDVQTVKRLLDANDQFVLIDCREPDEHALVQIPGARLLPMSEIQNRVTELQADKHKHMVVHCHHGGRSLRVANWLREQGFANVQSMAGGIDQWAVEIDPALPRY